MNKTWTNRDLYLEVAKQINDHRADGRSLEVYLRALYGLAQAHGGAAALSPATFLKLLSDAFVAPPADVGEHWFQTQSWEETKGFQGFCETLEAQVVDLIEMEKEGMLQDEQRYFGLDAPRGGRWYNFDPCTYLECGMMGAFGGWEAGDDTGRDYVPGLVTVMREDGEWDAVDPRELDSPAEEVGELSWDALTHFLRSGQWYE